LLKIIDFATWRQGIAPLWNRYDYEKIPIYNNPYNIIQYPQEDIHRSILFFPVCYYVDGEPACYSSIYNISDHILRIRGVYVLPKFRHKGLAHKMLLEMINLFPSTFYRVVGFWREDSYERFIKHSYMKVVPGTDWIWSSFTHTKMKLLYIDKRTKCDKTAQNRLYIRSHINQYGLGGTNNLNVDWSTDLWLSYYKENTGVYDNINFYLDFDNV